MFPIFVQPIFIVYLFSLSAIIYIASKPKNEFMNLYLAFVFRWATFIIFTIISLTYIPENTLIAIFLLIYLNTTFNPQPIKTT
ncbi:MAG: hypothetical protein DBW98_04230 [SAR86 cluster bacterium]|uniref:Uncharacterized protein n=1 Tax=SAR86 cluster bacterium TaxID=2030880 RepID=A0A368BIS9_9GAMM|nr:MAG: hypothetical protein DBW98_04230 [SAR86 cluster bacterium]